MSLRARSYQRILARTVLTAWVACLKGSSAMLMRDRLDVVFKDEEFADLFPKDGRPGLSPGQLALGSALQFAENLSVRPRTRSAPGSTESTRWAWSWMIPASTIRCCASSGPGWPRPTPRTGCCR